MVGAASSRHQRLNDEHIVVLIATSAGRYEPAAWRNEPNWPASPRQMLKIAR